MAGDPSNGSEDERRRRRGNLQRLLLSAVQSPHISIVRPPAAFVGLSVKPGSLSPTSTSAQSRSSRQPRAPKPVDHQRVRKDETSLLGSGAFGKVYRGLNEATGQLVAVKEIHFGVEGQAMKEQLQLLAREILIMKKLKHPNIVAYLGAHREDNSLLIYMEFVPGGSLASLVKKFGKLPEQTAQTYLTQMLCGLEYLHGQSVVHRDIKGDNVLLDVSGQVKLADFGTSKEVENAFAMAKMNTVIGTPWFMAPEIIKGEGYGFEADVWSVGATAIELLTAKPPFSNFPNPHAAMFHIACSTKPPPFPAGISPMANEFLGMCLQPDPSQRSSLQELLTSAFCMSCEYYASEEGDPTSPLLRPPTQDNEAPSPNGNGFGQQPVAHSEPPRDEEHTIHKS